MRRQQTIGGAEASVGRIISSLTIDNLLEPGTTLRCEALVDTGASHLVLPMAWKDRLGNLELIRTVDLETADQSLIQGQICGPVRIRIEGFPPIHGEVLFIEMEPDDGQYEPLLGYIPLEQSSAAIDRLAHRLLHVKHMDLK